MVYLDHAATTPLLPEVKQEIERFMDEYKGNPSSGHRKGKAMRARIEAVRALIAKTINALPEEIIFTSGATEANNTVMRTFSSLGKSIWISAIEHASIINVCSDADILPVDEKGFVHDVSACKDGCVSIIHANNEIGTIQDLHVLVPKLKEQNNLVHIDAVQSFTKVLIDVKELAVDYISISGHKIHGPTGLGVLYVRKGAPFTPLLKGGDQEFAKRAGTENALGIIGFGAALQTVLNKEPKVNALAFYHALKEKIDCFLNGPDEMRLWNNCNVMIPGISGDQLVEHASNQGIYFSTGSACESNKIEPSHVLTAIGLSDKEAHESIRISTSWDTTRQDLEDAVEVVVSIIGNLYQITQ